MKKNQSKVVRLNMREQAIIEFLREDTGDLLRELSRSIISSGSPSHSIKKLIQILNEVKILNLNDLIDMKFISKEHANQLIEAIISNKNILITGRLGAGKTTLLRALLDFQLNTHQNQKTIIVEDYPELVPKDEWDQHLDILHCTRHFGVNDLLALQNHTEQTLLCVGEIKSESDAATLTAGLATKSKVFATMFGEDWKSKLPYMVSENHKNVFNTNLVQHSFVIVEIENSPLKRQVTAIYEDQYKLDPS